MLLLHACARALHARAHTHTLASGTSAAFVRQQDDLLSSRRSRSYALASHPTLRIAHPARTHSGVPTKIAWKPFYSNLPPPALRGPGGFGDLPPLKKNMKVAAVASGNAGPVAAAAKAVDGPSDEDVEYWFKIMQEKMTTRFSELRRAFRTLDEDASGSLDRDEFKQVLVMFNLGIPDRVSAPQA